MTNVLHILDVAGVSSIINHYHNQLNYGKSELLYHQKRTFCYSISKFYEGKIFKKYRNLVLFAIQSRKNFDVIHIHGAEILIPIFKTLGKKTILHYHGSDIRHPGRAESKKRIFCRSLADTILYNSESMLDRIITNKDVEKKFIPNLIDTKHFSSKQVKNGRSLIITSSNHDKKKVLEKSKEFDDVDVIDLDRNQIPYRHMPNILSKYETYLDIRIMPWGEELTEPSTTALQALSCGCKVYLRGNVINSLPNENKPENYLKKLNQIYESI